MLFWVLTISYWLHLVTTVLWLGGLTMLALMALPAWQNQTLADNQWLVIQQKLTPYVNISMVVLWITGFIQMTNNINYNGFLAVDNTWAWAMLLKHIAVIAMTIIGLFIQFRVHPAIKRVEMLQTNAQKAIQPEQNSLEKQALQLLRLNLGCALIVLFFTAMATAA